MHIPDAFKLKYPLQFTEIAIAHAPYSWCHIKLRTRLICP